MNPRAKTVVVLEDYLLDVVFENGEHGLFSMKPYLEFPVFQPLKQYELFRKARVTFGFVSWNEEIDLSPDTLYLEAEHYVPM